MRTISVAMFSMLFLSSAWSQHSTKPAVYAVDEAYGVYSLLLSQGESVHAKGTLVIQQETVSKPFGLSVDKCLSDYAAKQFKDAIADYKNVTKKQWLLQPQFQIKKPYKLVSSHNINLMFHKYDVNRGWQEFYQRYPDSGGFITMSPVGFNQAKTLAVVYTGSGCGGLCGAWSFHLLEKANGKWKEVPGVTCITLS